MYNAGDKVRGEWHSKDGTERFVVEGEITEWSEHFLVMEQGEFEAVKITKIVESVGTEGHEDSEFGLFLRHELTLLDTP